MANICEYEVHVKGTKKAALMVLNSMPAMDYLDVKTEYSESNNYVICFTGNCKWSVNYGVTDNADNSVSLTNMTENEIQQNANNYWNYSLRAKSEMFQCEILVHYWSEESGFDQFDHYKNGKCIKQRKIAYNYDKPNKFDWNKTEFIGHEGEFDESVDGEEQDNNVMNMLLGVANGNFGAQEEPDNDNNDMSDFIGQLNQISDLLHGIADDLGIDIDTNDTSISGTNFDLYKWTFTEGQTARGDGWIIAIPDGFKVIDSAENRVFEAVPINCEDADEASVRILPGMSQDVSLIKKEMWMYHEKARAGIASILGVTSSKFLAQLMGSAPLVLSVGWSDVCGYILVQDTGLGSCSYQIAILTDNCQYQLRVQTNAMTDEDKNTLSNSIIEWLKTMRLDKENKSCPKEPIIDSLSCSQCLEKGDTSLFELALEQAKNECQAANNGLVAALEFAAENGLLDDNAPQMARNILLSRMEVQEFYLTKIDNVINSAIKTQKGRDIIKSLDSKLKELCEPHTSISINNEEIVVEETVKIVEIREKWVKSNEYNKAQIFKTSVNSKGNQKLALEIFEKLYDYRDSAKLAEECRKRIEELEKEDKEREKLKEYSRAQDFKKSVNSKENQKLALEIFEKLSDYRDSAKLAEECRKRIEELEKEEEDKRIEAEKAAKLAKLTKTIFAVLAVLVVVAIIVVPPMKKYNKAVTLMENHSYDEAISLFTELGNYKDSADKKKEIEMEIEKEEILDLFKNKKYSESCNSFKKSYLSSKYSFSDFLSDNGYEKEITEFINDLKKYEGDYISKKYPALRLKINVDIYEMQFTVTSCIEDDEFNFTYDYKWEKGSSDYYSPNYTSVLDYSIDVNKGTVYDGTVIYTKK